MKGDWIEVAEELPPVEAGYRYVSVNVRMRCGGAVYKGFYDHRAGKWHYDNGAMVFDTVTEWKRV